MAVAVGCAGAPGAGFTVRLLAGDIQPALFFTVTLYGPGARLLKTPVVLVYVVPSIE